jgi:hypothetical protein
MTARVVSLVQKVFRRIARDTVVLRLGIGPDVPVQLDYSDLDPRQLLADIAVLATEDDSDPEAVAAFSGLGAAERVGIVAQALKEIEAEQQRREG